MRWTEWVSLQAQLLQRHTKEFPGPHRPTDDPCFEPHKLCFPATSISLAGSGPAKISSPALCGRVHRGRHFDVGWCQTLRSLVQVRARCAPLAAAASHEARLAGPENLFGFQTGSRWNMCLRETSSLAGAHATAEAACTRSTVRTTAVPPTHPQPPSRVQ